MIESHYIREYIQGVRQFGTKVEDMHIFTSSKVELLLSSVDCTRERGQKKIASLECDGETEP